MVEQGGTVSDQGLATWVRGRDGAGSEKIAFCGGSVGAEWLTCGVLGERCEETTESRDDKEVLLGAGVTLLAGTKEDKPRPTSGCCTEDVALLLACSADVDVDVDVDVDTGRVLSCESMSLANACTFDSFRFLVVIEHVLLHLLASVLASMVSSFSFSVTDNLTVSTGSSASRLVELLLPILANLVAAAAASPASASNVCNFAFSARRSSTIAAAVALAESTRFDEMLLPDEEESSAF